VCVGGTIKFTFTFACTNTGAEFSFSFSFSFSCQLSQPQFHFDAQKYATKFLLFPTYQTEAGSVLYVCGCSKRGVGVTLNGFSTRHAYIYMLMTSLQPLKRVSMWNYSFNYRTKRECIWYQSKTEATRSSKTLSSCNLSDGNGKMGRKEHKDTVAV